MTTNENENQPVCERCNRPMDWDGDVTEVRVGAVHTACVQPGEATY